MMQDYSARNFLDENNMPAGGIVQAIGLQIQWQDGPLGRGSDRSEPNGAFVETVIAAVRQRIEFYQRVNDGQFACQENEQAISYLSAALDVLNERTKEREARQVEGTHTA